jgi:hypothetical protein
MCLNCVISEKMFVDVFGGRNAELCLINLIFMARSPPQKNSVNTKWRTLLLCVFALTYRLQSVSTLKVFCTTRDFLKLFKPQEGLFYHAPDYRSKTTNRYKANHREFTWPRFISASSHTGQYRYKANHRDFTRPRFFSTSSPTGQFRCHHFCYLRDHHIVEIDQVIKTIMASRNKTLP